MGKSDPNERRRGWLRKFGEAFLGIKQGMAGEGSFLVHVPVAIAVLTAAAWLQLSVEKWCLLLLCIAMVISAELLNSSIETLAKKVTEENDPLIAKCLHISSGAVLVASLFAAVVGAAIFLNSIG